jgi:hypothetical protein
MPSEATLYEDARVDAAIIATHDGGCDEPFWQQAYTSTIQRTRSLSIFAGNGETSLCEVAALLNNETVMEALALAGAARTRNTEQEAQSRSNRLWLKMDWRELNHDLRYHIIKGILQAGNSRLTVTDRTGKAGSVTIGDRRGHWFQDGKLRWDISKLPASTREAIISTSREFHPPASPAPAAS